MILRGRMKRNAEIESLGPRDGLYAMAYWLQEALKDDLQSLGVIFVARRTVEARVGSLIRSGLLPPAEVTACRRVSPAFADLFDDLETVLELQE